MNHPAYAAMRLEAVRHRWPESFRTDLTKHDRKFLSRLDPIAPFFWVLRRYGTFLCTIQTAPIDGSGNRVWQAPHWFHGQEEFAWFVWTGAELRPLPQDPNDAACELRERAYAWLVGRPLTEAVI